MTQTQIKNRIRKLRFEHGEMTQEALARGVEVTRQTIIALEAAKYTPSLLLSFRIAEVFGVKVEDVFQYDGRSSDRSAPAAESGAPQAGSPDEMPGHKQE